MNPLDEQRAERAGRVQGFYYGFAVGTICGSIIGALSAIAAGVTPL